MILEPEKSLDLSCASWRLRKASGIVRNPKSQAAYAADCGPSLKTWEPDHRGQEKTDVPAHAVRPRENSALLCLFVRFKPSMDWRMFTHIGRAICLFQSNNLNANSSVINKSWGCNVYMGTIVNNTVLCIWKLLREWVFRVHVTRKL